MGVVTILQNEILFLKRFYPRAELKNKIRVYNQKGEVRIMLIFFIFYLYKDKNPCFKYKRNCVQGTF